MNARAPGKDYVLNTATGGPKSLKTVNIGQNSLESLSLPASRAYFTECIAISQFTMDRLYRSMIESIGTACPPPSLVG
ncbi:hypothetical protein J2T57_003556 [Natronocella acetinitrilica]|uniref:Uncharacterized protein n=1 Tax=Natronocella acetinitrilica TaxID=414046 RepID=A0AAE3G5Y5_9GAMM|nr:hypothetical protein [Natronocella acetinitrilica]